MSLNWHRPDNIQYKISIYWEAGACRVMMGSEWRYSFFSGQAQKDNEEAVHESEIS